MDQSKDIIIRSEHVSKLYGLNKAEATKMMAAGSNKGEVYKKTGCTVALWDVNLEIPRGKIFVIIGLSGQVRPFLKKDGLFLCSGIIDDRAEEVARHLREAGWDILRTRQSEGWFSYLCR